MLPILLSFSVFFVSVCKFVALCQQCCVMRYCFAVLQVLCCVVLCCITGIVLCYVVLCGLV